MRSCHVKSWQNEKMSNFIDILFEKYILLAFYPICMSPSISCIPVHIALNVVPCRRCARRRRRRVTRSRRRRAAAATACIYFSDNISTPALIHIVFFVKVGLVDIFEYDVLALRWVGGHFPGWRLTFLVRTPTLIVQALPQSPVYITLRVNFDSYFENRIPLASIFY